MSREFRYEIQWSPRGMHPGHHRSAARGDGYEFREHVPLLRDPDPRRIDMHATLRDPFGEVQVRAFRARRALTMGVLADASASMGFGQKWRTLAEFSATAAYSAYRTGDAFTFQAAGDAVLEQLSVVPGRRKGLDRLIESQLQQVSPQGTAIGMMSAAQRLPRQPSLIFLLSDFHMPLPQIAALLSSLARHAVVPVVIWDLAEFALPHNGRWSELRDAESGATRLLWMRPGLRARIKKSFQDRQTALRTLFAAAGTRPLVFAGNFAAERVSDYFSGGGDWPDVAA